MRKVKIQNDIRDEVVEKEKQNKNRNLYLTVPQLNV